MFDGSLQGGDDDCVWDFEEVVNFVGSTYEFIIYHN